MSPQWKANSANNLSQMLFARYLWSLLFLYDALLYLTNWNNAPNKRKWRAEKACSAKFGCDFESSLSVTAHTCLIVGIYSARVFTQTRAPFALAFSTQHGSCFPNKSDCWQTCKLMIWTPETIWIGKNTKLVCGAFGPCHVFIVTVTGKFLLPSPSVLLKERPNIIQQF